MIAKTLVFVCAAFGLVAGSCFEVVAPQQCQSVPQFITVPATQECSQPCVPEFVVPSCSEKVEIPSCSSSSSSSSSSCCLQPGNGPESSPVPAIQAPDVTLPAVEGPAITLCSPQIPAPRVLAQRCICTKTIVKPQVYTRTVTIPRIQRYIKRTVTPVVENVSYKSTPISQECGSSNVYVAGCGSSTAKVVFPSCPKTC